MIGLKTKHADCCITFKLYPIIELLIIPIGEWETACYVVTIKSERRCPTFQGACIKILTSKQQILVDVSV